MILASILALSCLILSAAVPALAADPLRREVRTGSSTVGLNSYSVIGEFTTDQSLAVTPDISYTVFTIGDNGPVYYDILLMDQANYTKYQNNGNFSYIAAGSKIGQSVQSVSVSTLPLAQQTHYFLVADNTNLPAGGSTPTQELRVGYVLTGYDMSIQFPSNNPVAIGLAVLAVMAILAIIVVVLLVLYFVTRKKKTTPTPPMAAPMVTPMPVQPVIKPMTPEGNCPVCGKPVSADFMVCPNCGNRLK
jgi:hypothetical protein